MSVSLASITLLKHDSILKFLKESLESELLVKIKCALEPDDEFKLYHLAFMAFNKLIHFSELQSSFMKWLSKEGNFFISVAPVYG